MNLYGLISVTARLNRCTVDMNFLIGYTFSILQEGRWGLILGLKLMPTLWRWNRIMKIPTLVSFVSFGWSWNHRETFGHETFIVLGFFVKSLLLLRHPDRRTINPVYSLHRSSISSLNKTHLNAMQNKVRMNALLFKHKNLYGCFSKGAAVIGCSDFSDAWTCQVAPM